MLLDAQEWLKDFKGYIVPNKSILKYHDPSVARHLLVVCLDSPLKLRLAAEAKPKENKTVDECLEILKKIFFAKYPPCLRRYDYLQLVQKEGQSIDEW